MKPFLYIYIFPVIFQDFVNVENHAYWQKLFRYELRLQETLETISRSVTGPAYGAQMRRPTSMRKISPGSTQCGVTFRQP